MTSHQQSLFVTDLAPACETGNIAGGFHHGYSFPGDVKRGSRGPVSCLLSKRLGAGGPRRPFLGEIGNDLRVGWSQVVRFAGIGVHVVEFPFGLGGEPFALNQLPLPLVKGTGTLMAVTDGSRFEGSAGLEHFC